MFNKRRGTLDYKACSQLNNIHTPLSSGETTVTCSYFMLYLYISSDHGNGTTSTCESSMPTVLARTTSKFCLIAPDTRLTNFITHLIEMDTTGIIITLLFVKLHTYSIKFTLHWSSCPCFNCRICLLSTVDQAAMSQVVELSMQDKHCIFCQFVNM